MWTSAFLGVLIGIVMGLTGAGGGVLAVPALVLGMGWSMQQTAPVALIAVAGSSALGACEGLYRGLVRYRAASVIVLAGLPFAKLGIATAAALPQSWLMAFFSFVLLIVAVRLLRRAGRRGSGDENARALARINPDTGRFFWTWRSGLVFSGIGALSGFMTGLLGVGGGFIVVPALLRFTNMTVHAVAATALMVVALVGGGSVAIAVWHGAVFPMPATLFFALAVAVGMGSGRVFAARLSAPTIQRGFAAVLLFAAATLVAKMLL